MSRNEMEFKNVKREFKQIVNDFYEYNSGYNMDSEDRICSEDIQDVNQKLRL